MFGNGLRFGRDIRGDGTHMLRQQFIMPQPPALPNQAPLPNGGGSGGGGILGSIGNIGGPQQAPVAAQTPLPNGGTPAGGGGIMDSIMKVFGQNAGGLDIGQLLSMIGMVD